MSRKIDAWILAKPVTSYPSIDNRTNSLWIHSGNQLVIAIRDARSILPAVVSLNTYPTTPHTSTPTQAQIPHLNPEVVQILATTAGELKPAPADKGKGKGKVAQKRKRKEPSRSPSPVPVPSEVRLTSILDEESDV